MQVLVVLIGIALVIGALFWAWPLVVGLLVIAGLATKFEPNSKSLRMVFAPLAIATAVLAVGATVWWVPIANDMSTSDPAPAESDRKSNYVPSNYDYGGGGDPTDIGDVSDACTRASRASNMSAAECVEAFGY